LAGDGVGRNAHPLVNSISQGSAARSKCEKKDLRVRQFALWEERNKEVAGKR